MGSSSLTRGHPKPLALGVRSLSLRTTRDVLRLQTSKYSFSLCSPCLWPPPPSNDKCLWNAIHDASMRLLSTHCVPSAAPSLRNTEVMLAQLQPSGSSPSRPGRQSGKLIILAAHRVVQAALVGSSTLPASCTETPANSLRHWLSPRENSQGDRTWHHWVLGLSLQVWGCLGTSPKSRRGCFGC